MKIDKTSFGTHTTIGELAAKIALPKYNQSLSEGIFDAFQKLRENGTNDELDLFFALKQKTKNTYNDTLVFNYFEKEGQNSSKLKSRFTFNPQLVEHFSKEKISTLILKIYEKLKVTTKKADFISGYPSSKTEILNNTHKEKINLLLDKFGVDDWTCA